MFPGQQASRQARNFARSGQDASTSSPLHGHSYYSLHSLPRPSPDMAEHTEAYSQFAEQSCGDQLKELTISTLSALPSAEYWCINKEDVEIFEADVLKLWKEGDLPVSDKPEFRTFEHRQRHENPSIGPSIHWVNENYIKKETLSAKTSWSLMRHPQGLKCDLFATHCWEEGIFEFLAALKGAWPTRTHHLWACFTAIPQNFHIQTVIGDDICSAPFTRALRSATHLLVIPNTRVSIYARLWCVYEAHIGLDLIKEGALIMVMPRIPLSRQAMIAKIAGMLAAVSGGLVAGEFDTKFAYMMGPLAWLLVGYAAPGCVLSLVCAATYVFPCLKQARKQIETRLEIDGDHELLAANIFFTVIRISFFGFCCGHSFQHFRPLLLEGRAQNYWYSTQTGKQMWWELGEEVPFVILELLLVLVLIQSLRLRLQECILDVAGRKLAFESVTKADCTNEVDEERIREAIKGHEQYIDESISRFRSIGKFSRGILRCSDLGVSNSILRGTSGTIRILQGLAGSVAWSFWWLADLHHAKNHGAAITLLCVFVVVMLVIEHELGALATLEIAKVFYFGIAYVILSNLPAAYDDDDLHHTGLLGFFEAHLPGFYNHHNIRHGKMSESVWPLQGVMLTALIIYLGCHYLGVCSRMQLSCKAVLDRSESESESCESE
eukprot:TRINITY_DN79296_c0_g1_i1.p1 TRINITY_DN79296_c0_g1~~TRINITY_DN79296_c0_g1_i1.p1  ORF type:complete len:664 (+),score=62.73 TRINITY_DN79296_c0_g1_i1:72-2063(+)